jgi:hypothetical protein
MGARLAPLAGLGAVIVIVVGAIVAGEIPDADEGAREIVSFYAENDDEQQFGSALLAYGALLFLVFLSSFWGTLRTAQVERRVSSTLAFAGGVVLALGLTLFAAIGFVLGDLHDDLPPAAVQTLNAMNADFFFPAAVGVSAFYFGSGAALIQTGVLPKWLGWVTIVLAVVAITPVGFVSFLGLGIWLIVVSILLALRAGRAPASADA